MIDAGYRGEVRVLLLNTDPAETFRVEPGDRIAQLVVAPIALAEPVEARRSPSPRAATAASAPAVADADDAEAEDDAGVRSRLPAASIAKTRKAWRPGPTR